MIGLQDLWSLYTTNKQLQATCVSIRKPALHVSNIIMSDKDFQCFQIPLFAGNNFKSLLVRVRPRGFEKGIRAYKKIQLKEIFSKKGVVRTPPRPPRTDMLWDNKLLHDITLFSIAIDNYFPTISQTTDQINLN